MSEKTAFRRPIIAANWKMNKSPSETKAFIQSFLLAVGEEKRVDIVLAPPYVCLPAAAESLSAKQNIKIAAQNMHWETSGAYTGEISVPMLRELFVSYVIIGHSERRQYFGETDENVNRKVRMAHEANLRPIVCVGESLEQREAGQVEAVLERQVRQALAELTPKQLADTVLAYEPIWAIGTGVTATVEQAQEAQHFVRQVVAEYLSAESAPKIRIQYGGSVKPGNAGELMACQDIDGFLVGGASLEPRSFYEIIAASVKTVFSD